VLRAGIANLFAGIFLVASFLFIWVAQKAHNDAQLQVLCAINRVRYS
jgi:hypothetical protein